MNRLLRDFVGFVKVSRLSNLAVIALTQYLTAFYLVKDFRQNLDFQGSLEFYLLVISTLLVAAGGYIINDYYDQKIDMINRPAKVIIGIKLSRRMAMLGHFLLTISGIACGFVLSNYVGIIHLTSAFLLWFYSNYLRRITLIGNILIAILAGVSVLLVLVFLGRIELMVVIYAVFAMTVILIREILKDMVDVKGDAAFGCRSIPVIFGIRGAKLFIYGISTVGICLLIVFLILVESGTVRYYFIGLAPVFAFFIFQTVKSDTQIKFYRLVKLINAIIVSGLVSMALV